MDWKRLLPQAVAEEAKAAGLRHENRILVTQECGATVYTLSSLPPSQEGEIVSVILFDPPRERVWIASFSPEPWLQEVASEPEFLKELRRVFKNTLKEGQ